MSEDLLSVLFSATAFFYAIAGFGGGSTYNSLLVLGEFNYQIVPVVALTCNLVVVSGGLVHFKRTGNLNLGAVLPFMVASIPAAHLGGRMPISELWFVMILGVSLLASGFFLLHPKPAQQVIIRSNLQRWVVSLPAGFGLGLLSGLTGIGGGIFLAPLMYFLGWARPRIIAASASLFIFVNSLSGLTGHIGKFQENFDVSILLPYVGLPVAVLIGGQLGSIFGSRIVSEGLVRKVTGVLVVFVGVRIISTRLLMI